MGSYNYKLQKVTYTAKEVAQELELPFGRNKLYKLLVEMGILDENHMPNDFVLNRDYILYHEVRVHKGGRRLYTEYVPFFTDSGIDYVRGKFIEFGILKNNNEDGDEE
jgi:hypothetical protein